MNLNPSPPPHLHVRMWSLVILCAIYCCIICHTGNIGSTTESPETPTESQGTTSENEARTTTEETSGSLSSTACSGWCVGYNTRGFHWVEVLGDFHCFPPQAGGVLGGISMSFPL